MILLLATLLNSPFVHAVDSCRIELVDQFKMTSESRSRDIDFQKCEAWARELRAQNIRPRLRAWFTDYFGSRRAEKKTVLVYDHLPRGSELPYPDPDIRKNCVISTDAKRRDRLYESVVWRSDCEDQCRFFARYTFESRYCSWDKETLLAQPPVVTTCKITVGNGAPQNFVEDLLHCQTRCGKIMATDLMTDVRCLMTDTQSTWERFRAALKGRCDRVDGWTEAILDRKLDSSIADCETFCRARDAADPRAHSRCRVQVPDRFIPNTFIDSHWIYQNP